MHKSIQIAICGVEEVIPLAAEFEPTHMVSLLDRVEEEIHGIAVPATVGGGDHLRLTMADVSGMGLPDAPTRDQIRELLNFGDSLPENARVIIHCRFGLSRSAAVAYLLLAQSVGMERCQEAMSCVLSKQPDCFPNRLVVEHGDAILSGRGDILRVAHEMCWSPARAANL